jgi:N-acetylneuraminate synthase/N,N'-diacetyllegionaminate synthase
MNVWERIRDPQQPVFCIAEAGSNHNGDFDTAIALIDAAATAGADAVKFQSFLADELVRKDSPDYDMLKSLEMPKDWYAHLKVHAESIGLVWFSTVSNEVTLGWLEEVGCQVYKVGSPTITHLPLIQLAAMTGKPLIISTGIGRERARDDLYRAISRIGNDRIVELHCVSEYPAKSGSLDRFLDDLKANAKWGHLVDFMRGYSDHTLGIGTAVGAVALGARVIEKHFTLDKTQDGPDHHFAADPPEFAAMVKAIRECEASLVPVERPADHPALRTLHAAMSLPKGTVLERKHLKVIRPNDGLPPQDMMRVIGQTTTHELFEDEPIREDCYE